MVKRARFLTISLLLVLVAASPEIPGDDSDGLPPAPSSPKAVLIGISGITWEDLAAMEDPFLDDLISRSVIANMSVRVTNNATDAYATFGAGQRMETDASAAWAFNGPEQVENGPALSLWFRRFGSAPGDKSGSGVLVPTIEHLIDLNQGRAFNAVPGLLGNELDLRGRQTAVVGNADLSLGPLPSVLPSMKEMQEAVPPETGIHREAALAAMDSDGVVPLGNVTRSLLSEDPDSPFGIKTDPEALLEAFRVADAFPYADLIVVETGDTARADLYTEGLSDQQAVRTRRAALEQVLAGQLRPLMEEVDPQTLVAIIAATTPGGPRERGQLRPVIVSGPGITPGLATTRSTRRAGIITVPDLSATIARHLGLSVDRFGAGYPIRTASSNPGDPTALVQRNLRAVVHDSVRAPVSIAIILLHLILYVLAVFRLRRGPLDRWLSLSLLIALAFPLASFASAVPVEMTVPLALALIIASALLLGFLSWALSGSPEKAARNLLAATALFFFVDLALGAPAQLDSVLGYTSVAAGRFFGLGNLGFALFASSILLLAAVTGDRSDSPGGRRIRVWLAMALVALAIAWIGHPSLGSDVGGVLTMIPALLVFIYALTGRGRLRLRHLPAVVLFTVAVALIFGLLDLARPVDQRTHLGDFLTDLADDPLYLLLIIRRKLGLAISLTFSTRWGLAVPGAIAVLVWLYGRARGQFRLMLQGRDALRAGLQAVFVAALVGSIVNDSGIAVAGMMLAVATPWALLTASSNGARTTA